MKRHAAIGLLLVLCVLSGHAQEIIYIPVPDSIVEPIKPDSTIRRAYSEQNLQQATSEDLAIYLEKARKLKRKGGILSIVGPVSSVAGFALAGYAYTGGTQGMFIGGTLIFLGGVGTTLVGLPKWICGSRRVNKVEKVLNTRVGAGLNVAPELIYLDKTQNLHPGLTLSLRF